MGTDDPYSPELPEPLIHHIQSLLPRKKAAETTLLSKSWAAAWSTAPIIDLDQSHFPDLFDCCNVAELVKYATKTLRRYKESNLRINTFRLCVKEDWYGYSGLASKWTFKALKLGATDLTIRLHNKHPKNAIPIYELFGSENLVRLCLKHSIIDQLWNVLNCQGLKSLALSHVNISTCAFYDILSFCPLLENVSLSHIDTNSDDKEDEDDDDNDNDNDDEDEEEDEEDDDEYEKHGLQKLTSLVMCLVHYKIQRWLLFDLPSKFPILKELTLNLRSRRGEAGEVHVISNDSLETLNFDCSEVTQIVEIDAPSIRKITFAGEYMPNINFRSTIDQWEETRVSLTLNLHDDDKLSTKWFLELSNFLTKFRLSKIHLCLHLPFDRFSPEKKNIDYREDEIEGLNVLHEVEDLTINNEYLLSMSFNGLLDGLFRICRPKMISQFVSPPDDNDDAISDDDRHYMRSDHDGGAQTTRDNDIFLCRALEQVVKVKSLSLPRHFKHGLTDLDEVIAQKLVEGVWNTQPIGSILDDSASEQRRFRFLLKWKPTYSSLITI